MDAAGEGHEGAELDRRHTMMGFGGAPSRWVRTRTMRDTEQFAEELAERQARWGRPRWSRRWRHLWWLAIAGCVIAAVVAGVLS